MKKLSDEIIHFFKNQSFVIVSTVDAKGMPHNACKGIVSITKSGRFYLLDLYKGITFKNLRHNQHLSISAVDEHAFIGYCLKGKAIIVERNNLKTHTINAWDDKITSRITKRVIKNIREERGHRRHPEALLPRPQYMLVMEVEEIVDLTPHHLK